MLPLTVFQALKIALADRVDRLVVAGDLDAFAARRAIEDLREVLSGMRCLYSSSHGWGGCRAHADCRAARRRKQRGGWFRLGNTPRFVGVTSPRRRGIGTSNSVLARRAEPMVSSVDWISERPETGSLIAGGASRNSAGCCGEWLDGSTFAEVLRRIHVSSDGGNRSTGRGPVLLVEDNPDIGPALAELLEEEGYDCIVAASGLDALEILGGRTPSLLLVDLLMPGMNGVDLIAHVRRDARWSDLPIVVMTAAGDNIFGLELESLNVPVLRKPVDLASLTELLARHSRVGAKCPTPMSDRGYAGYSCRQDRPQSAANPLTSSVRLEHRSGFAELSSLACAHDGIGSSQLRCDGASRAAPRIAARRGSILSGFSRKA